MPDSERDSRTSAATRQIAADVVALMRAEKIHASEWLDSKAAAQYLSLREKGLETMRRTGVGPRFSRPSTRIVRYAVTDLDAWLRHGVDHPVTGR